MTAIMASVRDTDQTAQIRRGFADYIYTRTGGAHISDTTIDCIIDECRVYAQSRALCRLTSEHLHGYDGDAGAALATVDAEVGVDGVALLVLIVAQKRIHIQEVTV